MEGNKEAAGTATSCRSVRSIIEHVKNPTTAEEINFEILKEKKKYHLCSTAKLLREMERLDKRQTVLAEELSKIDESDHKVLFINLGKLLWCNKLLGAVLEILQSRQTN